MHTGSRILLLALLAICAGCANQETADIVFRNVTVIAMATDEPFEATVIVDDGKISSIAAPFAPVRASLEIDGSGKFLLPGLIDSHVHLASFNEHPEGLERLLRFGVTTVRDMGADPAIIVSWRDEIAAGVRSGPELLIVGATLNGDTAFPFHRTVATPEDAAAAVKEMVDLGAVQIKVHNGLSADTFEAILLAANEIGIQVVGHIPPGPGALNACLLGMSEISHASALLEALLWRDKNPPSGLLQAITELTTDQGDDLYACMADREMAFAPNLSMYLPILETLPEEQRAMTQRLVAKLGEAALRAKVHNVRIIAATDANGADDHIGLGSGLHQELELLVEYGFTPIEALRTATVNPASHLGRGDVIGTIELGKQADLLLLCANPLEDISNTQLIAGVFSDGKAVSSLGEC